MKLEVSHVVFVRVEGSRSEILTSSTAQVDCNDYYKGNSDPNTVVDGGNPLKTEREERERDVASDQHEARLRGLKGKKRDERS